MPGGSFTSSLLSNFLGSSTYPDKEKAEKSVPYNVPLSAWGAGGGGILFIFPRSYDKRAEKTIHVGSTGSYKQPEPVPDAGVRTQRNTYPGDREVYLLPPSQEIFLR